MYLPGTSGKKFHAGELILGGYDYEFAKNKQFIYQDLVSDKYWAVNFTQGRLVKNGKSQLETQELDYMAMVDSGTSCIHIPYDIYESFMEKVSDIAKEDYLKVWSSMKYMQCSKTLVKRLPTLELVFGNSVFKIEPKDYVLWDEENQNFCLLLLLPSPSTNMWVLGDVFMRTVYTLFDLEDRRIGFLKSVEESESFAPALVNPQDLTVSDYVLQKAKIIFLICSVTVFLGIVLRKLYQRRRDQASAKRAENLIKVLEIHTISSAGSHTYTKNSI